jgi:hypothetical protein
MDDHLTVIEKLRAPFDEAMRRRGITPDYLARKLKAELNAKSVKVFLDAKTGRVLYSEKMIDWQIRQKARQDAVRLLGLEPPQRIQGDFNHAIREASQEERELARVAAKIALEMIANASESGGED